VKYARIERERRWLLDGMPSAATGLTPTRIVDRYLDGLRMRLREMTRPDGTVVRKLGQKVRLDSGPREVACTNFYLSDEEWVRLSALPGRELVKDRYAVSVEGLVFAVDVLRGGHEGVVLAELDGGETMPDPAPELLEALGAVREVTDDEAFTGAALARRPAEADPHR
jgi:CYTH domain-containing protein